MKTLTDKDVVRLVAANHLKANVSDYEGSGDTVLWDTAWPDLLWGAVPGIHVDVVLGPRHGEAEGDRITIRVYPPARLARRLLKQWHPSSALLQEHIARIREAA